MPRKRASSVGGVRDESFDWSGYKSRVLDEDGREEKRSTEVAQDYSGLKIEVIIIDERT
jgi:hypothetical protein